MTLSSLSGTSNTSLSGVASVTVMPFEKVALPVHPAWITSAEAGAANEATISITMPPRTPKAAKRFRLYIDIAFLAGATIRGGDRSCHHRVSR